MRHLNHWPPETLATHLLWSPGSGVPEHSPPIALHLRPASMPCRAQWTVAFLWQSAAEGMWMRSELASKICSCSCYQWAVSPCMGS